ncbi:MAG: hypothetical protein AAF266_00810 [Planctomycetota bacterium]
MPTPTVVATLPFSVAATETVRFRSAYDGEPAILSISDVPTESVPFVPDAKPVESLLDEACDLARRLGCDVRRRLLGHGAGGYRWVHGRLRIVLNVEAGADDRLSVVADALRGEPRLAWAEMSVELAEYLQPRRAA